MKILTIDIETRPMNAHVWGIWQQNIGINQIAEPGGILCFAAKYVGESKIHFYSQWEHGAARMARAAHKLLSEADAVMGWNSDKFDLRWFNTHFIDNGMGPPHPFAKVDLMKSAKRSLLLPSYKLDFVAGFLGVGRKIRTGGFDLWADVMAGDLKARAKMMRYNIQDVRLTERVYHAMHDKGWVRGLPNQSIDGGSCCPNCGSEKIRSTGSWETLTRIYKKWVCLSCQSPFRSIKAEKRTAEFKAVNP